MSTITMTVDEDGAGMRLDSFIALASDELSRSHAVKLIEQGYVTKQGKKLNKKDKVELGDVISILLPDAEQLDIKPENIALDIVYEDNSLLVINKPQGMVVHPAAGNFTGTLVNALLFHCRDSLSGINGVARPGIVHRIDKDTSGLLLVAKNDAAHLFLSEQLKDHTLSRVYYALVHGNLKEDTFIIDLPIGRSTKDRKKMCVTDKNARNAVTAVRVLKRFCKYTLIECRLKTGRTHQIRVHMTHIGHSIVGDKTYGVKKDPFGLEGQLLHAAQIRFIHPETRQPMQFSAPLPSYFAAVLDRLERGSPQE